MEMGSLAHTDRVSGSSQKPSKIPVYAREFKREWQYIRGINKKCGEFMEKLGNTTSFEEVFWSLRAKALINDFKNVLEAQKMGKLQNISQLKLKLSAVEKIVQLRLDLYYMMGNNFHVDFLMDDEFQDFFENFIIFTNSVKIKNEEDFEDDLYNDEIIRRTYMENDNDNDSDLDLISDSDFDSESDSDSDSD